MGTHTRKECFTAIFAKCWWLASARDETAGSRIWPVMAVPVSHCWAQPGSWRFLPGPFYGGVLFGHVPRCGGTKADAIKPNGFKVQAVKQGRDISSCWLKLLYVDHKYFQTYVYSMNHYSGAWKRKRVFSLACLRLASLLKAFLFCNGCGVSSRGSALPWTAAFETGSKKEMLTTTHPSGSPYFDAFYFLYT